MPKKQVQFEIVEKKQDTIEKPKKKGMPLKKPPEIDNPPEPVAEAVKPPPTEDIQKKNDNMLETSASTSEQVDYLEPVDYTEHFKRLDNRLTQLYTHISTLSMPTTPEQPQQVLPQTTNQKKKSITPKKTAKKSVAKKPVQKAIPSMPEQPQNFVYF